MEFIQGQQLDIRTVLHATKLQRRNLNVGIINTLAQLRKLEFPSAGSLLPDPNKIFDSTAGRPRQADCCSGDDQYTVEKSEFDPQPALKAPSFYPLRRIH